MTIRDETEDQAERETLATTLRQDAERMRRLYELAAGLACAAPLAEECATW